MLPDENRLRHRQDFATAVRRGRRAGRPTLVVHLYCGESESAASSGAGTTAERDPHADGPSATDQVEPAPARAGFVVSKAVGIAVVRNRVKRRLRHLIRDRLGQVPAGSLIVVRALPPAGSADHDQLARDLDAALRRLLGRPAVAAGTASEAATTGAGQ